MNRAASRWACALNLADCQTAMFRELKLSITDEESHLKMRLDALLSDVMTAGWPATLATVTAFPRCLPPVHCGGGGAGIASTGVSMTVASDGRRASSTPGCSVLPSSQRRVCVCPSVCTPVYGRGGGRPMAAGSGTFGSVQRGECLWQVNLPPPPGPLPFGLLGMPMPVPPASRRIASAEG